MTDIPVFTELAAADVEQRSDAWHALREGRITGSRAAVAMGIYGSRRALWRELTGREVPTYQNDAMSWGTDFEPMARALYETHHGIDVQQVGFVIDEEFEWIGASPDGLVGTDGSVEFKCPVGPMYQNVPPQYVVQAHMVMRCAKRAWCDLLAWKPPFEGPFGITPGDTGQTVIWRIRWSPALWDEIIEGLLAFKVYLDTDTEPPKYKRGQKPVLTASVAIEAPIFL